METLTLPSLAETSTRLKALGWALDTAVPGYRLADVLARYQMASLDRTGKPLTVDGQMGPFTHDALFDYYAYPHESFGERLLAVARSQVGVTEMPLGSNRGPQVDLYLSTCGLSPVGYHYPWCASFVYWCAVQAARQLGLAVPYPKSAGVLNLWELAGYPEANLVRITPEQARENPNLITPGMLFLLKLSPGAGHMGLIEKRVQFALTTIEGNSNDTGSREGIEVCRLQKRTISGINLGFIGPKLSPL